MLGVRGGSRFGTAGIQTSLLAAAINDVPRRICSSESASDEVSAP